jgi:hypothetical protein
MICQGRIVDIYGYCFLNATWAWPRVYCCKQNNLAMKPANVKGLGSVAGHTRLQNKCPLTEDLQKIHVNVPVLLRLQFGEGFSLVKVSGWKLYEDALIWILAVLWIL